MAKTYPRCAKCDRLHINGRVALWKSWRDRTRRAGSLSLGAAGHLVRPRTNSLRRAWSFDKPDRQAGCLPHSLTAGRVRPIGGQNGYAPTLANFSPKQRHWSYRQCLDPGGGKSSACPYAVARVFKRDLSKLKQ